MKFKIKCHCGQSIMIKTRSKRKVINCPGCDQQIEAVAPKDEHSSPEIFGAVFDDDIFPAAAFENSSNSSATQSSLASPIGSEGKTSGKKSAPTKTGKSNGVLPMLVGFLGALILVAVVLLAVFLWPSGSDDDSSENSEEQSEQSESNLVLEVASPLLSEHQGKFLLDLEVASLEKIALFDLVEVTWVVTESGGQRYEKTIEYRVLYELPPSGEISFELPKKLTQFPITTFFEAPSAEVDGNVIISNVLVFDKDGKELSGK